MESIGGLSMNLKKILLVRHILASGLIFLWVLISPAVHSEPGHESKILLIVFSYESLLCESCHKSLLEFCQDLQDLTTKQPNLNIIGVMNLSNPGSERLNDSLQVFRKQLSGFRQANSIRFPVIVHSSEDPVLDIGSRQSILLLDIPEGVLKRWAFPVTDLEFQTILQEISSRKTGQPINQ